MASPTPATTSSPGNSGVSSMSTTPPPDAEPWLRSSNPWAWLVAFVVGFGCFLVAPDIRRHWLDSYSSREEMCAARMLHIVQEVFPRWASEHAGACPSTIDEL